MDKLTKKGLRDKNGEGSSSGSHDGNKNTMKIHRELIFSINRPQNWPHEFKEYVIFTIPKFLEPQKMGVILHNEP